MSVHAVDNNHAGERGSAATLFHINSAHMKYIITVLGSQKRRPCLGEPIRWEEGLPCPAPSFEM
jgi:hypothetical protein